MAASSGVASVDIAPVTAGANLEGEADGSRGPAPTPHAVPDASAVVAALLRENVTGVEFFQAVRLLEYLAPERDRVGGAGDPTDEVAHFTVPPSLSFPASEIQALSWDPARPTRVAVNFLGLTGPLGVLPSAYTLLAAERARAKDATLVDFLDIFHHRLISLFYRAWEKTHFAVGYERDRRDRLTEHLHDLVGLGADRLRQRLGVPDETLLYYAGLLAPRSRPAQALRQLLADYFAVPVEIEQFVGEWYPITVNTQCRLGEEADASNQLGLGAVAGDEVWDHQARISVRLGPLARNQYDEFLPTGAAHASLRSLTRFFTDDQLDVEVQLVLARDEVPPCILGADDADATPLGWCTWLRRVPLMRDPDDTILSL